MKITEAKRLALDLAGELREPVYIVWEPDDCEGERNGYHVADRADFSPPDGFYANSQHIFTVRPSGVISGRI